MLDGLNTELDSVACAAPLCDTPDFRVGRSQNHASGLCRESPLEITTISKSIMDLVFHSGDFRARACPIIFSKRLGVCNASSTHFNTQSGHSHSHFPQSLIGRSRPHWFIPVPS